MSLIQIIDAAVNTTSHLSALVNDGIEAIIRYDDRWPGATWKQIHLPEVRAIKLRGLHLGIVYEHGNSASGFTESLGHADAVYSLAQARARGQPAGSAVYFAVDYDHSAADISAHIIPYFQGVADAFVGSNLRFGAYCSGLCSKMLRAHWPQCLVWITCSLGFAGSTQAVRAGQYDLWQGIVIGNSYHPGCSKTVAGLGCDWNCLGPGRTFESAGLFIPWSASVMPDPVQPPPPVISHDATWLQGVLQSAGYYHGPLDGIVGPLTIAAMIKYAEVWGNTA